MDGMGMIVQTLREHDFSATLPWDSSSPPRQPKKAEETTF